MICRPKTSYRQTRSAAAWRGFAGDNHPYRSAAHLPRPFSSWAISSAVASQCDGNTRCCLKPLAGALDDLPRQGLAGGALGHALVGALAGEHLRDRLSRCRLLRIETEHLGDSDPFLHSVRSALVCAPRGADFRTQTLLPRTAMNRRISSKRGGQGRSRVEIWGIRAGMACDGRSTEEGVRCARARKCIRKLPHALRGYHEQPGIVPAINRIAIGAGFENFVAPRS